LEAALRHYIGSCMYAGARAKKQVSSLLHFLLCVTVLSEIYLLR
jgi:hypothetical protein